MFATFDSCGLDCGDGAGLVIGTDTVVASIASFDSSGEAAQLASFEGFGLSQGDGADLVIKTDTVGPRLLYLMVAEKEQGLLLSTVADLADDRRDGARLIVIETDTVSISVASSDGFGEVAGFASFEGCGLG